MRHFLMIVLSLLLAACWQSERSPVTSDAETQQRLAGTWVYLKDRNDGQFKSVTVIAPDGSYTTRGTLTRSNGSSQSSWAGTLLVSHGVLIETTTMHNNTNVEVPEIQRFSIVKLDEREWVVRGEEKPDKTVIFRKER
jgi:hypothetical protein